MLAAHAHTDLGHFADSRPVEAETVATERAIAMCRATRAPTYIVHLSSARALAACAAARAEGLPVFVETRPLRRGRARHDAAPALHGRGDDRPAVAGAVRRAHLEQRGPPVRHVPAQR